MAFGVLFPSVSFGRKIPYDRTYVNVEGFTHKSIDKDKTLEPMGPYPPSPPKVGKIQKPLNIPKSDLGGGGGEGGGESGGEKVQELAAAPSSSTRKDIDHALPERSDGIINLSPSSSSSYVQRGQMSEKNESAEASQEQLNNAVEEAQIAFERAANFGIEEQEVAPPTPKKKKSAQIDFVVIPD